MHIKTQTFRRLTVLALVAILFNALAVTASYALAAKRGMIVVEMCSSLGLKKIAISTANGETRHSPSSVPTAKHCPLCLSLDHTTVAFQAADNPALIFHTSAQPIIAGWVPVHDPQALWVASLKQEPPARS